MKKLFVMTLALLASAGIAYGQATTGTLVGTVTDKTGAVVANATISIINEETHIKNEVKANGNGEYQVPNLPAGLYDISTTAPGFSKVTVNRFTIDTNKSSSLPIILAVAGSSSTVEVTSEASVALDTTTIQLQQTFTPVEVQDLPSASIGGLGALNLALLSPGVVSAGGIGAGTGPVVGGQRQRNNNFMIEGIDNNNQSVAGPSTTIPNDAVESFTFLTNQFSPEFGHSTGGQFNTTIFSGTNKFHGTAYEYFQNRNLNAQDNTTKRGNNYGAAPRFDFNRFGGQIGGPIFRDKLFFFANIEKNQTGQSLSRSVCAPSAAGYTILNGITTLSANNRTQLEKYLPAGTTPNASCTPITVAGTAIPTLLYAYSAPVFQNTYNSADSIDYNLSQNNTFRIRYAYNTTASQDTAANLSTFFQPAPAKNQFISISYFHTFTPNIINEMRVGFNRFFSQTPAGNFAYPGLDSFPNLVFNDLNGVQIGPNPNAPQDSIQNLYQITDNVNYTRGKHTFRFGFDGRKYISPSHFTQRVRGDYEYTQLDLFLRDVTPDSLGERSSGNFEYYGDQTALYGYANDVWRVTPKFTANIGLRYEFTSTPAGVRAQSLNILASSPGLITFGAPQPQTTNFAPRIGFAYAPGNGNTSIRAGFGMGYDVLFNNLGTLSKPPQYGGTQDVVLGAGNPNFLAGGGLAPGPGTLLTYPTVAAQRAATAAFVPNQVLPYSETWNLNIQHVFAKNYTAQIGYLGTRGIHLPVQTQLNRQAEVTAANALPTIYSTTPQATTLTNTLVNIRGTKAAGGGYINQYVPAFIAGGFGPQNAADPLVYSNITSYQPFGGSNYHGLSLNLTRRMINGLLINTSYTFSKLLDNSTAEVFSTTLTPRRPQDFLNFNRDYSVSAIDHRHRFTAEVIYLWKPFKSQNYLLREVVGDWEVAPVYTYQSPEYFTPQSGVDSNLNGDSAGDRTIINPNGVRGTGSAVTGITAAGVASTTAPVAYYFNSANVTKKQDPNAYYIQAGLGQYATAGRNTEPLRPTNNFDLSAKKVIQFESRFSVEFDVSAINVLNHQQFTGGSVSTINTPGTSGLTGFVQVGSPAFNNPQLGGLTSNARFMQLDAKFKF